MFTRKQLAIHHELVHTLKPGDRVAIEFGPGHMINNLNSKPMLEASQYNKIWEVLEVSNDERQFSVEFKHRSLYLEVGGNDYRYNNFIFIRKVH